MSALKTVERFYCKIWNSGRFDLIAEICDPEMTFRGSLGTVIKGTDGFTDYVRMVRGALGHYHCQIEDAVVEGNRVFARMNFSGIHEHEFLGYPATGNRIEWLGAALFTLDVDRITDLWVLGDVFGLRQLLDRQRTETTERKER